MSYVLSLMLEVPESVNHLYEAYTFGKHAAIRKSRVARRYEESMGLLVNTEVVKQNFVVLDTATYGMRIEVTLRSWRGDLDNFMKAIIDTVTRAVGMNDSRIVLIIANKRVAAGSTGSVVLALFPVAQEFAEDIAGHAMLMGVGSRTAWRPQTDSPDGRVSDPDL